MRWLVFLLLLVGCIVVMLMNYAFGWDPTIGGIRVVSVATVLWVAGFVLLLLWPLIEFVWSTSLMQAKFSGMNDFRHTYYCPHCHASLGPASVSNDYRWQDDSFRCPDCGKRVK